MIHTLMKRYSKRTIFISAFTVLLCVSLLLGATFAWFTDTAGAGTNIIKAGNLDITAYYYDVAESSSDAGDSYEIADFDHASGGTITFSGTANTLSDDGILINEEMWEPGAVGAKLITVENTGSLAAKVKFAFVVGDDEDEDGEGVSLADALWFDVLEVDGTDVKGSFLEQSIAEVQDTADGLEAALYPSDNEDGYASAATYILIYGMDEEAGNEYQNLTFSANVSIVATQNTYEEDDFGSTYDENAVYPDGTANGV